MSLPRIRSLMRGLLPTILITITTSYWNFAATGRLAIDVPLFFLSLALICQIAGGLLIQFIFGSSIRFDGYVARLLVGFLAINTALYAALLFLPIGIGVSASIIILIVLVAALWSGSHLSPASRRIFPKVMNLELVFLLIAAIAVTFWCQDLLSPVFTQNDSTTLRAWSDIFFHLRQISIFSSSHGANSISDFQMSGAPSHAYHYASYTLPAAVMALTTTNALEAYAGTFVPFGLLLTSLAAFTLLSSLMGRWPGAAAGLAILLAPDAAQQGFGNGFLAYHWMQHIAPAGLYGVAMAAVAWTLMFEGCRERKFSLVCCAYFIAFGVVFFKAQIFVANAYLILVFPALFMTDITRNMRRIYFYVCTAIFILVIYFSQYLKGVPTMRLDGTGISAYGSSLLSAQNQGAFYSFVTYVFDSASGLIFIALTSVVLLFGTFGLWTIAYPFLALRLKHKLPVAVIIFPALIVFNYLVMSQGLALDLNGVGRPEELLNRPFVWAFFIVCTWGGASLYFLLFGDAKPEKKSLAIVILIAVAAIFIPAHFGHNIHSLSQWQPNVDGVKLSSCFVKSAEFIRDKSDSAALVQDSSNDLGFALTGLSERQAFAIDAGGVRGPAGIHRRLAQLNFKVKKMELENQVLEFMDQNSITWYLRRPEDNLKWPNILDRMVAYNCGGYRVYQFKTAK